MPTHEKHSTDNLSISTTTFFKHSLISFPKIHSYLSTSLLYKASTVNVNWYPAYRPSRVINRRCILLRNGFYESFNNSRWLM